MGPLRNVSKIASVVIIHSLRCHYLSLINLGIFSLVGWSPEPGHGWERRNAGERSVFYAVSVQVSRMRGIVCRWRAAGEPLQHPSHGIHGPSNAAAATDSREHRISGSWQINDVWCPHNKERISVSFKGLSVCCWTVLWGVCTSQTGSLKVNLSEGPAADDLEEPRSGMSLVKGCLLRALEGPGRRCRGLAEPAARCQHCTGRPVCSTVQETVVRLSLYRRELPVDNGQLGRAPEPHARDPQFHHRFQEHWVLYQSRTICSMNELVFSDRNLSVSF